MVISANTGYRIARMRFLVNQFGIVPSEEKPKSKCHLLRELDTI